MGLTAEFEIGCEHLPLVEVAAAVPSADLSFHMVATADGHTPFVVHVTGGPAGAVENAFESSAFVGEYTLVGESGDARKYQVIPAESMREALGDHLDDLQELRSLASNESVIERIRVTPTGWIQSGWFADREAFDEYRAFWQRNVDFRLRRLTRDDGADDDDAPVDDGLTDRQRDAVRTAYEMGYFDIPRKASLDDIAGELDISASSLSERLRRAQTQLVESSVDLDVRRAPSFKAPRQ